MPSILTWPYETRTVTALVQTASPSLPECPLLHWARLAVCREVQRVATLQCLPPHSSGHHRPLVAFPQHTDVPIAPPCLGGEAVRTWAGEESLLLGPEGTGSVEQRWGAGGSQSWAHGPASLRLALLPPQGDRRTPASPGLYGGHQEVVGTDLTQRGHCSMQGIN